MFHYSALIFAPLFFLNPKKLNIKLYLSVLFIPILFTLANVSLHSVFALLGPKIALTSRYYQYIELTSQGVLGTPNTFNVIILFNIFLGALFILKWRLMFSYNKYAVVIIKIQVYSIALFYLFYDVGSLAFRIMDLLNVVQMILIPFVIYIVKDKRIATLSVIICALIFLWFNISYVQLLEPYLK